MTREDIKLKKHIHITMYGNPGDDTIKVSPDELDFGKDGFTYTWGWPGPDFNRYKFDDYGKTWAFKWNEFEWRK